MLVRSQIVIQTSLLLILSSISDSLSIVFWADNFSYLIFHNEVLDQKIQMFGSQLKFELFVGFITTFGAWGGILVADFGFGIWKDHHVNWWFGQPEIGFQ